MIGAPRVHYRVTDSTNERAKGLADAGALHGTLVTADEQEAGRGRQGRAWTAPPGSAVLMSLILRDLDERHALLPLAASVAVCEALPADAAIKWPNDVWIDGRKVAGILMEGRPQEGWAVLGIGVNVSTGSFPPELAETATSLRLAGHGTTPAALLPDLLAAVDRWLHEPPHAVLAAWRARDALKGGRVRWSAGEGIADGIDESGALRVQTDDGLVTLDAGEVHLLR
jgi:BirA family transcriptional regulator, biotin operon repressor / biotin---[acetyl-CoA-carboxylase] ligase